MSLYQICSLLFPPKPFAFALYLLCHFPQNPQHPLCLLLCNFLKNISSSFVFGVMFCSKSVSISSVFGFVFCFKPLCIFLSFRHVFAGGSLAFPLHFALQFGRKQQNLHYILHCDLLKTLVYVFTLLCVSFETPFHSLCKLLALPWYFLCIQLKT